MERIGRYEIGERLGSGAFSIVYEAYDTRLESPVALKLLADNWMTDPDVRARFRQEAVLLRRVQQDDHSSALIDVHDIDETDDGRPFAVLQLARGGSLSDRLRHGQPTSGDLRQVITTLAVSLATLHEAGVVHRDVKPSNLLVDTRAPIGTPRSGPGLLDEDDRLLLGDLGLAKDLLHESTALTVAGGTPRYMAPEQRDPAGHLDGRADLYSATAVVKELLEAAGPVSKEAASALAAGMAENPEQRCQTALEWEALMLPLADLPDRTQIGSSALPFESAPELPEQRSSRFSVIAVAGLVVLLLAALAAGGFLLRGVSGSDTIVGPTRAAVGQPIELEAVVEEGETYSWRVGDQVYNDPALRLTPRSSGTIEVELIVTDGEGNRSNSSHSVVVTAE